MTQTSDYITVQRKIKKQNKNSWESEGYRASIKVLFFFCFLSFLDLRATGTFISQITYTTFISWCFRQVSVSSQHFFSLHWILSLRFLKYLKILMEFLHLTILQMRQNNGFLESIHDFLFFDKC